MQATSKTAPKRKRGAERVIGVGCGLLTQQCRLSRATNRTFERESKISFCRLQFLVKLRCWLVVESNTVIKTLRDESIELGCSQPILPILRRTPRPPAQYRPMNTVKLSE